jgi:hypothetical protein
VPPRSIQKSQWPAISFPVIVLSWLLPEAPQVGHAIAPGALKTVGLK